jgi:hypothetical protein
LLALERPFRPAHHHRFQFRKMVRCHRLHFSLPSASRVGSWHCPSVASAHRKGRVFSVPTPFSCHIGSPSCNPRPLSASAGVIVSATFA